MLILSRLTDEVVMIGDDIEIMIVSCTVTGKVRLGITAPAHLPVHRKEVYDAIVRGETRKDKGNE